MNYWRTVLGSPPCSKEEKTKQPKRNSQNYVPCAAFAFLAVVMASCAQDDLHGCGHSPSSLPEGGSELLARSLSLSGKN